MILKLHKSLTSDRICDAIEEDDYIGFCIICGEEASGVEPDAEKYTCESCESKSVYGAEQLLYYIVD